MLKITILTSNQPRHVALINSLSEIAEVNAIIEERNNDFKGNDTPIMNQYFWQVKEAEIKFFPLKEPPTINYNEICFFDFGEINKQTKSELKQFLNADVFVVFGSSYIKGWLADFLVEKKAINIHMGLAPFYRGSNNNAWAIYDGNPDKVGATIHYLSKGLDSGEIIETVKADINYLHNSFEFTMSAVKESHLAIMNVIQDIEGNNCFPESHKQDKSKEIRNSKYTDWTDEIAKKLLK